MTRTLLVTNDFPPQRGGIESFVYGMAQRFDDKELVVYCSTSPGWEEFDAEQDFQVIRDKTTMLLPTRRVGRTAVDIARKYDCDRVWFGAAAPLGLLAPRLRAEAGIKRAVGLTHGHEVGWAALPIARGRMRAIAEGNDILTYLGDYTKTRLHKALGQRTSLRKLTFGVDTETFSPEVDGRAVRKQWNLESRSVIVCVSRLVPRKGQDLLIEILPHIKKAVPDAALFIVGKGPYEKKLRQLAHKHGVNDDVVFAGLAPENELASYYKAGDVFAMPCRTRLGGIDFEGLGAVFVEAAGVGLPTVVGDSGGAPGAVINGHTGYVVDGTDPHRVAAKLTELLADKELAAKYGAAGREWVLNEWTWETQSRRLKEMLSLDSEK